MGNSSRRKGGDGERELARLLRDLLGVEIFRNLQQSRDGGADLDGIPGVALEVKRAAKLSMKEWWQQSVIQAEESQRIPCLAYRLDRQSWQFVLALGDLLDDCADQPRILEQTVTLPIEAFATVVKQRWV